MIVECSIYPPLLFQNYAFCDPVSQCDVLNNSTETSLTSLVDIKLRSYLHSFNFIWFMQIALEENGYTRFIPFKGISLPGAGPSRPHSCQISWPSADPTCIDKYMHSKCFDSNFSVHYPVYDPRCRK